MSASSSHGAVFVRSDRELADLCRSIEHEPAIALDTEFERTRTYYPRPALVQLGVGERVYLIDPLAVGDFAPLAALLVREDVDKVMHAFEADNEILELLTGVVPRPVFDTQVAAAFAGQETSTGYRRLVRTLLGVDLGKDETRSDWLQRPLSDAQIGYAVRDVVYLEPLYEILREHLARSGRESWARREVEEQQERRRAEQDPHCAYLRIRQASRLDAARLPVLRSLAAWREREARRRDRPRQRILTDDVLIALAARAPRDASGLHDVPGLPPRVARRDAEALLAAIAEAMAEAGADAAAPPAPLTPVQAVVARRLRGLVRDRAAKLELPPALLATRSAVEALVRGAWEAAEPELPAALRGWRADVIGEPLLAALPEIIADEDGR